MNMRNTNPPCSPLEKGGESGRRGAFLEKEGGRRRLGTGSRRNEDNDVAGT
jgi:hypothetical protein